jgi:hypothetical protein
VFADVGEFVGGDVIGALSSDPLRIDGLALQKEGRVRLIVANLTNAPQVVTVECPGTGVDVKGLDETNAEEAMQSPRAYRRNPGLRLAVTGGMLTLSLLPYAVARVDVMK